jgi:hypothetical protein
MISLPQEVARMLSGKESVMIRKIRSLAAWFLLAVPGAMQTARAQAPETAPQPVPAAPRLLESLPQVADQPASLYQPASLESHGGIAPERPYFAANPLLDPPMLPPGWFFTTEAAIVAPHVGNHLANPVVNPVLGTPDVVRVPGTELPWTVSPTFEMGYRLPSGFGELSLGYRFMVDQGLGTHSQAGQSLGSKSRLDVNQIDFNYASSEFSLWPNWDMKWSLGLRLAYVYFDAESGLPAGLGAGSVIDQHVSDFYSGVGSRVGLELARRIHGTGLSLVARLDLAALMGRIRQGYGETVAGAAPLAVDTHVSSSQTVPTLNLNIGLGWQPPDWCNAHFFVGYQYEHWWDVGRLGSINSMGDLVDQGVLLRAEFEF